MNRSEASPAPGFGSLAPFVSVIIPVYNGAQHIAACLGAVLASDYFHFEVIVVDDGSVDDTVRIVRRFPCRLVQLPINQGQAAARNAAVAQSRGEVLFFLDADILIETDTLKRIVTEYARDPQAVALFCSYQKETPVANFFSRYKNYQHHYTHQNSAPGAATFCGGYGAIYRDIFLQAGGFNAAYRALEDIELGYRLTRGGHRIRLAKEIQLTHLKRYTFWGLIKSDLFNRAIPWTVIMLEKRIFRNDLNTKTNNLLSGAVAFLLVITVCAALFNPAVLWIFLGELAALVYLNRDFYAFIRRHAGCGFAVKSYFMSVCGYLCSDLGLFLGVMIYFFRRIGRVFYR